MKRKPSAFNYFLSFLIWIGGFVACIVFIVTQITGSFESSSYLIPGIEEIQLSEKGRYTIFHEYQSLFDDIRYDVDSSKSEVLRCRIKDSEGEYLDLIADTGSSYTLGSKAGRSIYSFNAPKAGQYTLEAGYNDGYGLPTVVKIKKGAFSGMKQTFLGSIAILFGTFVSSVILFVSTLIRRRKFKNEKIEKADPIAP